MGLINQNVFLVAQMELAFLKAKHSVANVLLQIMQQYQKGQMSVTQGGIFSSVQVANILHTINL